MRQCLPMSGASVTLIEISTSCNDNQVFGGGSGFSLSYQAPSYSITKTRTENKLKRAITVTMKLQNIWTWITDQENSVNIIMVPQY